MNKEQIKAPITSFNTYAQQGRLFGKTPEGYVFEVSIPTGYKIVPDTLEALDAEIAHAEFETHVDHDSFGTLGDGYPDGYLDGLRKAKEIMGLG